MKKTIIAAFCMMLAALMIMLVGFNWQESSVETARKPILLILEHDTGAFMLQLRLGVQQAVEELGSELAVEVLGPDGRLSSQRDWAEYEFSGAVVCAEDAAVRETALQMLDSLKIPSVVINNWDNRHNAVCHNEAQLGELAAELAAEFDSVCLVGGSDEARQSAENRLGSCVVLEQEFDFSDMDAAVIALDEAAALEFCRGKAEEGWQCALIAVDTGETRAGWLEQGTVQALMLASPYAMGYRAAMDVLWEYEPKRIDMPYFAVDESNMYEAQNVKLVFPLLN